MNYYSFHTLIFVYLIELQKVLDGSKLEQLNFDKWNQQDYGP